MTAKIYTIKGDKVKDANRSGRPSLFKTPEELQSKIDEYFDDESIKPTISGLAYHLGFESRQSCYDYEKKDKYSYTIERARLRIESIYEGRLADNQAGGSIFALKNMGWKDKTESEITLPQNIKLPDIIIK